MIDNREFIVHTERDLYLESIVAFLKFLIHYHELENPEYTPKGMLEKGDLWKYVMDEFHFKKGVKDDFYIDYDRKRKLFFNIRSGNRNNVEGHYVYMPTGMKDLINNRVLQMQQDSFYSIHKIVYEQFGTERMIVMAMYALIFVMKVLDSMKKDVLVFFIPNQEYFYEKYDQMIREKVLD